MTNERKYKKNIIAVFNKTAVEYDQIVPFFSAFATKMIKWLNPQKSMEVLDIATGRGALIWPTLKVVGAKGKIVAIDLSTNMVNLVKKEAATKAITNIQVLKMDVKKLMFDQNSFDLVLCGFALHIFPNPQEVIAEVFKVLKPGGIFAFSMGSPIKSKRGTFQSKLREEFSPKLKTNAWQIKELKDAETLLKNAGFKKIKIHNEKIILPVKDPNTFWKGEMSHGFRNFFDALPLSSKRQFKARMMEKLEKMHNKGGIKLERGATFYQGIKPF